MASKVIEAFVSKGVECVVLGEVGGNALTIELPFGRYSEAISHLRRVWYRTSYLFDRLQGKLADQRWKNFDKQALQYKFPEKFSGRGRDFGIELSDRGTRPLKAAIVREKGTNGDREMALSLYAAGFDVKDITMPDLMNGKETLEDIRFLVFPGGFSNSDVLGAARGWAGAFLYNDAAQKALQKFFARPDTLSLGVCNGCQLMVGLEDLSPFGPDIVRMDNNASGKFESTFVAVEVLPSKSVMLQPLVGSTLGAWVAHGEGRFRFSDPAYIREFGAVRFAHAEYPGNPNGADGALAAIVSPNGRHVAIMPHLERSFFSWQWPYYPQQGHEISPWGLCFAAARDWLK